MSRLDRFAIPSLPECFPPTCPFSGLPVRTYPEWSYTNAENSYRTSIALIGDHIFWVVPRGYVTAGDMRQAMALAASIKAEAHPGEAPFVFIENFEYLRGGTADARRLYLEFTNSLTGLLGSFPYGMPPFFRLSFNLSRRLHLHRYKVHMVAGYEDAIRSALETLAPLGLAPSPTRSIMLLGGQEPSCRRTDDLAAVSTPSDRSPEELTAHVDALLAYLAHLDFEKPGIPSHPDMVRDTTMAAVYAALAKLKIDMDQFLEEYRLLMAALQERQLKLRCHSEIIESRNRELQNLLQKNGDDQKELGEVALQNVQTLLKPLVAALAEDVRRPDQKAWVDALNERIDDLTKELVPSHDLSSYGLTPREIIVARMIRHGSRTKTIARQIGVSVRTVESFRSQLRKKLGIHGRPRNLRTVLLSIPD
jgi:DNA-binding CsgD family transcriptional regulator